MYKISKAERLARKAQDIANHRRDLTKLGYKGLTLTPLRKLENQANKLCTDYANGDIEEQHFDTLINIIRIAVIKLFRKNIREYGFFINQDPRGYALKLDNEKSIMPEIVRYKDWGGYSILCPEFN